MNINGQPVDFPMLRMQLCLAVAEMRLREAFGDKFSVGAFRGTIGIVAQKLNRGHLVMIRRGSSGGGIEFFP